jgi:hypothetical protein
MRRLEDLSSADWLLDSDTESLRLITFGPAGFEAYARLRYIPDPYGPGLSEASVMLADDHPSDLAQARIALKELAQFTVSTAQCFFCVWPGYSGTDPALTRGPLVELPHREYVLFAGELKEIDHWEETFGGGQACPPPSFVWPSDHRWCFTSDVDPHWAGIAASSEAIAFLTHRTDVDIVADSPESRPLAYR